jgi:tetratricopeptide (TPR) repeat protein
VCTEGLPSSDVATLIAALVDRSLVTRVSVDPPRYALLETIRQYAAERLAAAGETAATRDAHAQHFATLSLRAGRGLTDGEDKLWLAVFDREHDNFRVALDRLIHGPDPVAGARMASALGEFWWVHAHGHNREGIRWLEAALARLPQDAPVELRVALCYHLGVLWAHDAGDWDRAAEILDRGLCAADATPDEAGAVLGYAQTMRAKAAGVLGDADTALTLLAEAATRLPADADPWGASFVAWTRGSVLDRSDATAATDAFEEALRVQQEHGLRGAIYLICAATVAKRAEAGEDLDRARRLYEDVLAAWRELGTERIGQVHAAAALLGLARIALHHDDRRRAGEVLAEVEPLVAQMGDRGLRAEVGALRDRLGAADETPTGAVLQQQGEVWRVGYAGELAHVTDRKGLRQLSELVRRPDIELSALELAVATDGAPRDLGDAGPLLDEQAKRAYRRRLRDLDEAVADAEADRDPHRAEQALEEREALLAELSRATGLAGRDRRAGSAVERARVNVTRTLRDAIASIGEVSPALGAHLRRCVHTGTLCRYSPDERLDWRT